MTEKTRSDPIVFVVIWLTVGATVAPLVTYLSWAWTNNPLLPWAVGLSALALTLGGAFSVGFWMDAP